MAAVHVANPPGGLVVLCEEQGGVHGFRSTFEQQSVDQRQGALEIIHPDGAQRAQAGHEGRSYQRRGDSFAGDIADCETEAMGPAVEEIVEISASVAGLEANRRIGQTRQLWQVAGKQPG